MPEPQHEILTHEETLQILSQMARSGSVTAATSLERALGAAAKEQGEDEVGDAIDRILRGGEGDDT